MPTSSTRLQVRQEIVDRLYAPDVWRRGQLDFTLVGTTTLTETVLDWDVLNPQRLPGAWIRFSYTNLVEGALEPTRRITQFNPSTGVITFTPAITDPDDGNVDYEIHYDVHPLEADRAINRVLRNTYLLAYVALSLVVDGTME